MLSKYKVANGDHNFVSYGKLTGKFNVPCEELYKLIKKGKHKYAIIDKRTEFFKLYLDVDLKDKDIAKYNVNITDDILIDIISHINNILESIIMNQNVRYVYADKENSKGIHLYYPDVIVDKKTAGHIVEIISENLKDLIELDNHFIDKMIDKSAYNTGLRIIYEVSNGDYYKINIDKSTYENISDDRIEQYRLTCIKSDNNSINFVPSGKLKERLDSEFNKDTIAMQSNSLEDELKIFQDFFDEKDATNDKIKRIKKKIVIEALEDENADDESNVSKDDVRNYVSMLSKSRSDDYTTWNEVGLCLHNINIFYGDIFDEFSQKSSKYDEKSCQRQWSSYKKKQGGLNIGSLVMWAKNDNPTLFDTYKKGKRIKKFVSKYKRHFPNNSYITGNIIMNGDVEHHIMLHDKYCPIYRGEHIESSLYLEYSLYGLIMKCSEVSCRGKIFPDKYIQCDAEDAKYIFNVVNQTVISNNVSNSNNQTTTNNSYSAKQTTADNELDVKIDEDLAIFDDGIFNKLILKSINKTPYTIAQCVHYLKKNEYNCTYSKEWFYYKNHKWNSKGDTKIREYISTDFVKYYEKVLEYYIKNSTEITNSAKKIKKIDGVINSLTVTSMKNNIVSEACEIYYNSNEDFEDSLDKNPYLIGFENGVYDLETMEFREGKPDDNITMSCGYDFLKERTENYDGLNKFIKDVLPDKDDRKYFLIFMSSCLMGKNTSELFTIATGVSGRNGKSKMIELMTQTLGDYAGNVSSKLFTRPRPDASSPDPGLLSLIKKRFVTASEPEKTDKFNCGFIKLITGNDSIELRNLYSNDMKIFKGNFKIVMVCNQIPDIDNMDVAFSKRLRCINFPTEFKEDPRLPHEKKIDLTLGMNFPKWKQDMMLILLKYYPKFLNGELKPTKNILKWTGKYREDVDVYLSFLNEMTIEKKGSNLTIPHLYDEFKEWFRDNFPGKTIPSNRLFTPGIEIHRKIQRGVREKKGDSSSRGIKDIALIRNIGIQECDFIDEHDGSNPCGFSEDSYDEGPSPK